MEGEIWKDIVGYKGLYQCSNKGRIKSLDRTVATKKGSRGFNSMTEAGRNGFSQSNISLCCNGKKEKYKNYKWKFKTERGD